MTDTTGWTTEDWKAFYLRWEEEQYHQKLDVFDDYYAPDLVDHHLPPGYPAGSAGKRMLVGELLSAFPDFRITLDDLIVAGDKVVERFTVRGTHLGEYGGIPATGKQMETHGISICRFVDGLEVEHWAVVDDLALLEQLGVIDSPYQD